MPYILMTKDPDINKRTAIGGINYQIMNIFANTLNFTYNIINCNSVWDYKLKPDNISCNGVVSELHHKVRLRII